MSPRFAAILFGFVPSALISLIVSGIATFRNAGPVDKFIALWHGAWRPSWFVAFPTVLVLVAMLAQAPAAQVR